MKNSVDCGQMGRIMSKPHAHLQTVTKTPAKFRKDRNNTVCVCGGMGCANIIPTHCVSDIKVTMFIS